MIIYLITNKINNKKYVGQTIKTLDKRWADHIRKARSHRVNMPIAKAITKYGKDSFLIEEIAQAKTRQELNELEEYYIKSLNTISPHGYNISNGGNCKEFSDDHRRKISEGIKKSEKSKAAAEKRRGEGHPMHKINKKDAAQIRSRFLHGESSYDLAKVFKITQPNIMSIINNKTWKDKEWEILDKDLLTKSISEHRDNKISSGENHPNSILTWEIVNLIRQTYLMGNHTVNKLSSDLGVKASSIKKILRNALWFDEEWEKSQDLVQKQISINRKLKKPKRLKLTKEIAKNIAFLKNTKKLSTKNISQIVNLSESLIKKFLRGDHPYYKDFIFNKITKEQTPPLQD